MDRSRTFEKKFQLHSKKITEDPKNALKIEGSPSYPFVPCSLYGKKPMYNVRKTFFDILKDFMAQDKLNNYKQIGWVGWIQGPKSAFVQISETQKF